MDFNLSTIAISLSLLTAFLYLNESSSSVSLDLSHTLSLLYASGGCAIDWLHRKEGRKTLKGVQCVNGNNNEIIMISTL